MVNILLKSVGFDDHLALNPLSPLINCGHGQCTRT